MTRLVTSDIDHIADTWATYEEDLHLKTGCSLKGLACNAIGIEEKQLDKVSPRIECRVIPVSWGEGQIKGFATAVASILNQLGFAAEITANTNIAGFNEAVEEKCDLIFFSDDDDFIVVNLNKKKTGTRETKF